MARFIEADVIQKIATEAQWLTQTRIPYKGQIMIVGDSAGKVTNIKVGDGVNPFSDLNYMFDSIQQNVGYIAIESNALPAPSGDVAWGMVTEGTYTFGGSDVFTVPDGHWGIANYSSGTWSLVDMGELPSIPVLNDFGSSTTDAISQAKATETNDKINAVTKTEGSSIKDYKEFVLYAGYASSNGGTNDSQNWISARIYSDQFTTGENVKITGLGQNSSIVNGTFPRIVFYNSTTLNSTAVISMINDNGQEIQGAVIPTGTQTIVVNLDGGSGVGADLPNSIYNDLFKIYTEIITGEDVFIDTSKIKDDDVIDTEQTRKIESDIAQLQQQVGGELGVYFDGIGYPQYELGESGDKYFDRSSGITFIKSGSNWDKSPSYRSYPFLVPVDFPWDIGYPIFAMDNGKYYIEWEGLFVEKVKSDYDRLTKFYVDPINGSDSNDGLTPETSVNTIPYAYTELGARNIILASGVYSTGQHLGQFDEDNVVNEPFILRCVGGRAIFLHGFKGGSFTWTNSSGAYSTTRSNVINVIDLTQVDENGGYKQLEKKDDIVSVQSTPNSWYLDGTTLYVRTIDDRVPDTNIGVVLSTQIRYTAGQNVPYVYFENIHSYTGSPQNALLLRNSPTSQYDTKVYLKGCGAFNNPLGNGLAVDDVKECIVEGSVAGNVLRDAFNYHTSRLPNGYVPMKVMEIDCVGYSTGIGSEETSSNGSTTHEGITILRMNSKFSNARGSVIADVNAGAMSLNLGITASEDTLPGGASFRINGSGSKMWIFKGVAYSSDPSVYAIQANTGSTAYVDKDTYLGNPNIGDVVEI